MIGIFQNLLALGTFATVASGNSNETLAKLTVTRLSAIILEACALMFVAYTGYGRIATLGEEIRNPSKNIPVAIIVTLGASMVLYLSVAWVSITVVGASDFGNAAVTKAAPLEMVAERFAIPQVSYVVAVGAVTSMLGVLINLVLGLSRVSHGAKKGSSRNVRPSGCCRTRTNERRFACGSNRDFNSQRERKDNVVF